jgi:hypothetical protein
MRKIMVAILFVFTLQQIAQAQLKPSFVKYKTLIDSLFIVDQQVQEDFVQVLINRSSRDSIKLFNDRKEDAFLRHVPILKNIFKKIGYPTVEKVGKETSSKFFTLVQHCDTNVAFQAQMLKEIKKQVLKKQVDAQDYAFLYDRVQLNSGKKQLYGSQLDYDTNYNAIPRNLESVAQANLKRKELGLETLEEYLKRATEFHKKQNGRK